MYFRMKLIVLFLLCSFLVLTLVMDGPGSTAMAVAETGAAGIRETVVEREKRDKAAKKEKKKGKKKKGKKAKKGKKGKKAKKAE